MGRWLKILPWLAAAGAVIILSSFILISNMRSKMLSDNGETKQIVSVALARVSASKPSSAADPVLLAAVQSLLQEPYVASVWLFDLKDGSILYNEGSTAFSGNTQTRLTPEMQRVLASLPPEMFTEKQRTALEAASSIQAEGEHNDIYRHLLCMVENTSGEPVALLAIAYEVNSQVGSAPLAWKVSLVFLVFGLLIYWLALPLWVFLDASRRGEMAWGWAIFVFFGNLIALIAYLLIKSAPPRSPQTE